MSVQLLRTIGFVTFVMADRQNFVQSLERDTGLDSNLENSTKWNCSDGATERAEGSRSQPATFSLGMRLERP